MDDLRMKNEEDTLTEEDEEKIDKSLSRLVGWQKQVGPRTFLLLMSKEDMRKYKTC
jgi:hypothetical protein